MTTNVDSASLHVGKVGEGGRIRLSEPVGATSDSEGGGERMKIRHLQLLLPVLAAIGAALFGGQGPWGP